MFQLKSYSVYDADKWVFLNYYFCTKEAYNSKNYEQNVFLCSPLG